MSFRLTGRRSARGGFTLVELLVVIGIIALLMSILLPTLGRVREQANRTKCLSNIRQVTQALLTYTGRNKETFPRAAGGGMTKEDWIYWEPSRDINESVIAPYLGPPGAIPVETLRCPSDNLDAHPGGANAYKYSYTVNFNICKILPDRCKKLNEVRDHAQKILVIEETSDTIDDGCWAWQSTLGSGKNVMSNRHDKRDETYTDPKKGYGNAGFCDGHVEYLARADSFDARFWHPTASTSVVPP